MFKKLVLFILLLITSKIALAAPLFSVTFVNPGFANENPTGDFWRNVSRIMQASANNLNIELKISYAERNHILMKQLISQALSNQPDYLIVVDEKSSVIPYLLSIPASNVKIIFLLNGPSKEAELALANAGHQIIGTIEPNNFQAGFKLMHQLARKSMKSTAPSKHLLALLGDVATTAALDRQKGMLAYLEHNKEIELIAEENCQWSQQEAYRITAAWLRRDPSITTIWAANDPIAIGALKAANELQRKVVVGGINWDKNIAPKLDVSIGGHVLLGAYTLTRLAHYHQFQDHIGHLKVSIFEQLDTSNLLLFNAIHGNFIGQLEFSRYINEPEQFTIREINNSIKQKKQQ
ncbi:ABC transporter substrate-binding protein [Pseudoalteromonas sp. PS5]|uniref:ABC transporter substrate-binding protein n=1 Tax=Pseudoalteromonas sp. PS5 TaxID=1437473 RepID=UPI000FFF1AF1|nr:ABC transporter substrate-binding protein [Pseudoalteromonas sp. PS5]RXE97531.1 sugar ABC transporter substrate-binding protein [Pseudoalteromonas sp. PS5]